MTPFLPLVVLLAAPPLPDVVTQATTEASVMSVGGDTPSTAVDLAVNPQVKGVLRDGPSSSIEGGYVGSYRLRQSGFTVLPYALHRVEGNFAQGREIGGVRLTGLASLVVGESTFDSVQNDLDQPFGLAATTTIVPVASFDVAANASHRPTPLVVVSSGARARAYATPPVDENGVPQGAEPLGGLSAPALLVRGNLVPQLRAGADVQSALTLTRRDVVALRLDVDAVTLLDRFGYVALAGALAWQHRLSRRLDVRVQGGAFSAWAPSAEQSLGLLPAGELTLTTTPVPIRGLRPSFRARAAFEPFYDPFLLVLTERGVVDGNVTVPVSRAVSMSLAMSTAVRLIEFAPKGLGGRGDDVYLSAAGTFRYQPNRFVAVDSGLSSSVRARAARTDRGNLTTPSVGAFVNVTGIYGFAF
jgi:hypothetical protein